VFLLNTRFVVGKQIPPDGGKAEPKVNKDSSLEITSKNCEPKNSLSLFLNKTKKNEKVYKHTPSPVIIIITMYFCFRPL
jgi:hypothetical protein